MEDDLLMHSIYLQSRRQPLAETRKLAFSHVLHFGEYYEDGEVPSSSETGDPTVNLSSYRASKAYLGVEPGREKVQSRDADTSRGKAPMYQFFGGSLDGDGEADAYEMPSSSEIGDPTVNLSSSDEFLNLKAYLSSFGVEPGREKVQSRDGDTSRGKAPMYQFFGGSLDGHGEADAYEMPSSSEIGDPTVNLSSSDEFVNLKGYRSYRSSFRVDPGRANVQFRSGDTYINLSPSNELLNLKACFSSFGVEPGRAKVESRNGDTSGRKALMYQFFGGSSSGLASVLLAGDISALLSSPSTYSTHVLPPGYFFTMLGLFLGAFFALLLSIFLHYWEHHKPAKVAAWIGTGYMVATIPTIAAGVIFSDDGRHPLAAVWVPLAALLFPLAALFFGWVAKNGIAAKQPAAGPAAVNDPECP